MRAARSIYWVYRIDLQMQTVNKSSNLILLFSRPPLIKKRSFISTIRGYIECHGDRSVEERR